MHIVITAEIMSVTPAMAAEWLSNKWGEQRTVRNGHVSRLLHDMTIGQFKVSPDAILRIKGKLANGQHRLEALVRYGKPLRFLVMESNDEELYKVIDAGMKRTVSDGLIGMKHAHRIPTVARWVLAYEANAISPHIETGGDASRVGSGFKARWLYSQSDLIDYCTDNAELLGEAAEFVQGLYIQSGLLRWSIAGALYCMASRLDEKEKVRAFLTELYVGGTTESAASDLRNRLIQIKGSKAKQTGAYVFGITIKAFRSYLNGSRPGTLRWSKGEDFPQLPLKK